MSKLTALEVFALELYAKGLLKGNGDEIQESLKRHKQMEKEQINDAYRRGFISDDIKLADDYYTETFGGDNE
jgi:hypothetical protein